MGAPHQDPQHAAAQYMMQGIVGAICDRPGESIAQRDARSEEVTLLVLAFQPRDPVELMLAGMAAIHVHLIQDSTREVYCGQDEIRRARAKTTIVALDRALVGFLRELRFARKRTIGAVEPRAEGVRAADDRPEEVTPAMAATPGVAAAETSTPLGERDPLRSPRPGTPEPPVPLLPPSRQTAASVAVMMAAAAPVDAPHIAASMVGRYARGASPPVGQTGPERIAPLARTA